LESILKTKWDTWDTMVHLGFVWSQVRMGVGSARNKSAFTPNLRIAIAAMLVQSPDFIILPRLSGCEGTHGIGSVPDHFTSESGEFSNYRNRRSQSWRLGSLEGCISLWPRMSREMIGSPLKLPRDSKPSRFYPPPLSVRLRLA
jgi:hypothetical protein